MSDVASASLAAMRHSCAHLLAAAVQELWPDARFGTGPATDDGFFYDIDFPQPVGEGDLPRIEEKMREIQARQEALAPSPWPVADALAWMAERGQTYKVELIQTLVERGNREVGIYRLGSFMDLCRGPHVAHTGEIGPFRLVRTSGAYWRGDQGRPQLTRIYGLCYQSREALERRLWEMEEAKKRDHRLLGRQQDLFAFADAVGPGLPLWLPKGNVIRLELERLARSYEGREGYHPVSTPVLGKEDLYTTSGHLPYYREEMYAPIEIEDQRFYLRPMCCPHHHAVYQARPRSYRDLPLRIAEYGQVFRYEPSGALSGLLRTRGFCQNDAHIYCREDQAREEFVRVMQLHARYYRLLGIEDFHMRLSLPAAGGGAKYVNDPEGWRRAEAIIREAMEQSGLPFEEVPGEAAFYGPKIDFMIRSAIGQSYAISTNQLDFVASGRFGLTYTGADGADHPVYVIHRAPLGSHERFVAFLLEHYGGALPSWLAPVQVLLIPISSRHEAYAHQVRERLRALEAPTFDTCLRVEVDDGSERMQKRILRARQMKIPYLLVVGDREASEDTVAVRRRDGSETVAMPVQEFARRLCGEIAERSPSLTIG